MPNGRVMVYCPNHPNNKKNGIYIRRAHLIMEARIGRSLRNGEVVHHKNNDPSDDRLSNLQLMTIREHRQWHMKHGQAKRMRQIQLKAQHDNKR